MLPTDGLVTPSSQNDVYARVAEALPQSVSTEITDIFDGQYGDPADEQHDIQLVQTRSMRHTSCADPTGRLPEALEYGVPERWDVKRAGGVAGGAQQQRARRGGERH